jgi:amino acid adenylation domain-containing protein
MRPVLRVAPAPAALLSFTLDRGPGGWTLRCDYRAHRLGPETVDVLLAEIADRLAPAPGGATPAAPAQPAVDTIHELVARQAAARPGAIAVSSGEHRLTYRQLDDWSATVAAALRARGAGPGSLVGVCLPRGTALIAALLGILRAGAAYVPLDPAYPRERLRFLARDADLSMVVGDRDDPALFGCPTLTPPAPAERSTAVREPETGTATDPAYVIYTSGSTGRPKGVVVEHRNVARLLAATADEFGLSPGDVWTCFHSVAFDFSVWEIWACLATGGRLVVVADDVIRDPEAFRALLHRERVTVLSQTPSAFTQLVSAERAGAPALAVRLLLFGGEPLDARILLPWFDAHPERRCRVVNMYGITETTVHSTWTTLTRRDALAGSRSVGRALPGWTVHVLDPYGRPVPPGVPGEIHVGGAGVARGYLGRPGLTAQRFRPDHLSPGSPARLYRSGDLGRLRPDGRLEHLGRLDGQVKIRGYRIELGEIRQHLVELPGVRAAAVLHRRRGRDGDGHLDAYVVGPSVDAAVLRDHLRGVLPAHLVPSTVTVLDALPTTGNGKLDAARLPDPVAPAAADPPPAPAPAAPDALRQRMSRVWQEVLGSPVTPDDNFFLSGGNSLLAIRVVVGLREQGIADVPVRLLYRHPTVRRLADALGVPPNPVTPGPTRTTVRSER